MNCLGSEKPLFVTKSKGRPPGFHPDKMAAIQYLFSFGFNAQEVADKIGMSRVRVQHYRKELRDTWNKSQK